MDRRQSGSAGCRRCCSVSWAPGPPRHRSPRASACERREPGIMTDHTPETDPPGTDPTNGEGPELDEPDVFAGPPHVSDADVPETPHPVNWNLLSAHDLETEWVALNRWVDWLCHTYGLPASVLPPFWHHHPELLWELSALHLHWLCAYDPDQNGSAPLGWHRDFADARQRLRDRSEERRVGNVWRGRDGSELAP